MPSRRLRKRLKFNLLIKHLATLAMLGFVGLGLFLLAVVATPLPVPQVARATEIYDVNNVLATKLFVENRTPVPLSEIPKDLQNAIVAVEDKEFYNHFGINPVGIVRAAIRNILAGKVLEGGSTITQQLARNLFLTQERTFKRKLQELFITFQLESRYSKQQILELYLNQIYLGFGTYGVEAASQLYFGKRARELSLAESALLAGLPRAPEIYTPFRNPDLARSRRNLVLDRMASLGYIPASTAAENKGLPLELAKRRPASKAAYFVDYILRQVRERHPEIEEDIFRGGYKIYTTMDVKMQEAAEKAFTENIVAGKPDERGILQPQGALVAMDPRNGYIKALVGGRNPENPSYNRAVTARRQPGSAFKPFLYAAVLSSGFTAADQQVCEYVSFPGGEHGEPYTPKDYTNDGRKSPYHWRPLSIREAIEISDNVVAVKWAATIGPEQVAAMARNLGIESPLEASLPLALGASEVTPLEMAAAYAPFANMGWRVKPMAIRKIVDSSGRVIEENQPETREVLDEAVAYILTDMMKGVITRGTAAHLSAMLDRPAAGKTGTTDRNADAWFIGYTPDLVTAVWVGNDSPSPLPGYGGSLAGPIWARFTTLALANLQARDFPKPARVVEVAVSGVDGLLPNPTSPVVRELFIAGSEPTIMSPQYNWPPLTPTPAPPPPPGEP